MIVGGIAYNVLIKNEYTATLYDITTIKKMRNLFWPLEK
jgi:hypothetical protein